jgi:hypothetical protein
MDSMLKTFSPSTESFEKTFKTAYSHGLEEIYSLENVDIKSIKPIRVETPKQKDRQKRALPVGPAQLVFDFCREALPPFYLEEPIQVLTLSKPLEKILIDQGKTHLRDLINGDFLLIGQGYKDEISQRLTEYLKGTSSSVFVDFYSLIRCLTGTLDRRKVKAALEPYLLEVYHLSPLENMELKRLSQERKKEWIAEIHTKLESSYAKAKLREIFDVYFKPWIRRRGLAKRYELFERMERISEYPEASEGVINFFSTFFGKPLFDALLCQVDEDVYAADRATEKLFSKVIARASTYFYKPNIRYPLPELISQLQREFALEWDNVPALFIEKCLRLASSFSVRKGENGLLWVSRL